MKRPVLLALIAAIIVVPAAAALLIQALTSGSNASPAASGPPPRAYRGSEPPAGIRLPAFTLRDYRGNVVRRSTLRGKVVLVTFLDTDCKTKCPIFASDIGAALRLLSRSERRQVVVLALTVNPARDTPASVRAFLRRRHALGIDFLLGTAKQMRPIWRAFHVVSAAETGNADVHSGLRSLPVRTLNLSTSQRKPGGRTSCGFEGSERLSTELSTPLPIQPGGRPLFIQGHVQSINRSLLGRDRLAYRESGRSRALNQALNPTLSGTENTDQTSDVEPCHLTV